MSKTEYKMTRTSKRVKTINHLIRKVDENTRNLVLQSKIDDLESDFYDSPNRLAEDTGSEDFEFDKTNEKVDKRGRKAIPKIKKRKKNINTLLKKNFNLKKIIKEERLEESPGLNFVSIKLPKSNYPPRKFCSVCNKFSKYTCTRCGARYCDKRCWNMHKEIQCIKFEY